MRSVEPAGPPRPPGLIGAVDNVLRLLRLFEDRELLRVNQVSREMGLSRSTVHRMLATLSHHQFVEQDEDSRGYRAGPALVDIGLAVVRNMDIRAISSHALVRLRDATRETVQLATLRGTEMLYVECVESEQVVKTSSRVGSTTPAHVTAAGQAVLAELGERRVLALYPSEALAGRPDRPPRTRTALLEQLAEVRLRGYATNYAESEGDVIAVGVAVKDRQGKVRAAVVVTGPRSRADQAWVDRVSAVTMRVATELSGSIV